jgi:mannose-6-phosphate isomerase-like protein (cupin superfamily)
VNSIRWQTLVSGEHTASTGLTFGVAEIMPGGRLRLHHHEPAETYYIVVGVGVVEIDEVRHEVGAGTAVFIPGNAHHRIMNTGTAGLQFIYTFPADSFADVVYHFDEEIIT